MKILHGRDLIIKADGVAIAAAKTCTVRVSAGTIPVSDPDDGEWEHSIPGRKSWTCSTNHLVTDPRLDIGKVGTVVQLQLTLENTSIVTPFRGFFFNAPTADSLAPIESFAVWDTDKNKFVYYHEEGSLKTWYTKWLYMAPYTNLTPGKVFHDLLTQKTYWWDGTTLVEKPTGVSGRAIITEYEVSANVGNLAHGSFSFRGSGPLE